VYQSRNHPLQPDYKSEAVCMSVVDGWTTMFDKHAVADAGNKGAWFAPYANMSGAGLED